MSQKATASAMQGRIAIFDDCKPLKMEEFQNRTFPIPSRESPGKGFCDTLKGRGGWLGTMQFAIAPCPLASPAISRRLSVSEAAI